MIDRIQSNTGVCLFFHPVQDKNAALNFTLSVNFTFSKMACKLIWWCSCSSSSQLQWIYDLKMYLYLNERGRLPSPVKTCWTLQLKKWHSMFFYEKGEKRVYFCTKWIHPKSAFPKKSSPSSASLLFQHLSGSGTVVLARCAERKKIRQTENESGRR